MSNHNLLKPDPRLVRKIQEAAGCSQVAATVIANRNIKSREELDLFLQPKLNKMRSPFSLLDTDKAVQRIHQALVNREKILVFVDYDADGVCSGVVLMDTLLKLGADVECYIPHREKEGYSITAEHILNVAVPKKINLIITADCGSTASYPVFVAEQHDINVIVTDHHEVDPVHAPRAIPFINPKRPEDQSGLDDLAGVGVAFYLMICLRAHLRREGYFTQDLPEPNLKDLTEIVSIGTIADCVSLVADNRILVTSGLEMIKNGSNRPGVRALLKSAGIDTGYVNATDIGFKIAPRINAASRMAHAKTAYDLLMCDNDKKAEALAKQLNDFNDARKELVESIMEAIERQFTDHPEKLENKTLVLGHEQWPAGVLGIIASKVAEKYHRPSIIFSLNDSISKGSARSIAGFNLYECFSALSSHLAAFGGHDQAAGLSIEIDNLVDFEMALEQYANEHWPPDSDVPVIDIDCEIGFGDVSEQLIEELERLGPFGQSNPEPTFISRDIRSSGVQILRGGHRKMYLEQPVSECDRTYQAVLFNIDSEQHTNPANYDAVVYKVAWNRWKGRQTLQMIVLDMAA